MTGIKGKVLAISLAMMMCVCYTPGVAFAENVDGELAIDSTSFPDSAFRSYIESNIDADESGTLSAEEIDAVTEMDLYWSGISSLEGIEHFKELSKLDASGNNLSEVDFQYNTKLETLDISENNLKAIDLSGNLLLKSATVSDNALKTIDVSKNVALQTLNVDNNNLSALDVSGNKELLNLAVSNNDLKVLNLAENKKLLSLIADNNELSVLSLAENTQLSDMNVSGNRLTSLDLTNNAIIETYSNEKNTYLIDVNAEGEFDLTTLPKGMDPSRTSDWNGAVIEGSTITLEEDAEEVTYTYSCGNNFTMEVKLQVLKKNIVRFNTGGGSTVDAARVETGQRAVKPEAPTRTGYTFKHWSEEKNGEEYDFNTPVTGDVTLYAVWEKDYATYTVRFETDGGSEIQPQKLRSIDFIEEPENPAKEGFLFKYWSEEKSGEPYDFNAPITKELVLYAVWAKAYNVYFDSEGGEDVEQQLIEDGKTIEVPASPKREGYTFRYWSEEKNGEEYDFDTAVTKEVTLHAVWEINDYTVSFNTENAGIISPQILEYGQKVTKPEEPKKEGYRFKHWSAVKKGAEYDFDTPVSKDMTLYAVWEINEYTVSFDSCGGTTVTAQTKKHGTKAEKPKNPTRTGYTFKYWSSEQNGSEYSFATSVTKDMTLYAVWEINRYTISFETDGGSSVESQIVDYGNKAVKPNNPEKEGFIFEYWAAKQDGPEYSFDAVVTEDVKIYAVWKICKYTVGFDSDGGGSISPQTVEYGKTVVKPADPVKEGFFFKYWAVEQDGVEYDFNMPVKASTVLYAVWEEKPPEEVKPSEPKPVYKVSVKTGKLPLKKKQSISAAANLNLTGGDYVKAVSTSNSKVLTVSGTKIKGKKKGSAVVTVYLASGLKARYTVKVQSGNVKANISLGCSKNLTMHVGEKVSVKASKTPVTCKYGFKYKTSKKKVAAVSGGVITAKKKGKATITVKCGSRSKKIKVKVI